MLNVRFRAGVVRETARVVHAAAWMPDGSLTSLCGIAFDLPLVEEARGMPCMRCTRHVLKLASDDDSEPDREARTPAEIPPPRR